MNKRVLLFSVLIIAIFLAFRFCSNKPEPVKEEEQKPVPLSISRNSATFNESFAALLQSYYALKNAFVTGDTAKVASAANELAADADSLNVDDIKGDSSIRETAKSFAGSISGSSKAIPREENLNGKLNDFNIITDALWSLTRTVQYNGQKIYYHFCPKALENSGGYWLSEKIETKGPYGIPGCGQVTDSVDYSKK